MTTLISYNDFDAVALHAGTIIKAEFFDRAKKPAYKIWADFGPDLGIKQTSAQVTINYKPEELIGKQIIGCTNLGTKNIAGFISEFLLRAACVRLELPTSRYEELEKVKK